MTTETFRHRVSSWTDKDGDLHLMQEQYDPLAEKWQEISHHVANVNEEAFRQELRMNGWIEPERASQVLETVSLCVTAMKTGMVDFNPHDEYVLRRAESLIEEHEGEQG